MTSTTTAVGTAAAPHARATLVPRGRFRLAELVAVEFGPRAGDDSGTFRAGFVVEDGDGYAGQAGVAVTQRPGSELDLTIAGTADPAAVTEQVARMLSVDVDGTGWDELGGRDELIGRLQRARPGLRPPLFTSAYEAAAWAVLSARRPRAQMAALRDRLSAAHGATFKVGGTTVPAFPTPAQLLAVREFPGLPEVKLARLHGVARAAADGRLGTAALRALDPAEASARLQELDGIGPFYAALVVVRALGHTDVPAPEEPRSLAVLGALLGRDGPVRPAEYLDRADSWRPWRTWAGFAVRAAGPRVLAAPPG